MEYVVGISYVNVVSRQLYGPGRTGKCGGAPQSWSNHFSRQCSSSSTQCGKQVVLYVPSLWREKLTLFSHYLRIPQFYHCNSQFGLKYHMAADRQQRS